MDATAPDDIDRLLDIREVAERVGVSDGTIRNMIAAGSFPAPAISRNRLTRWRRSDVAAWFEGLMPKPAPPAPPPSPLALVGESPAKRGVGRPRKVRR